MEIKIPIEFVDLGKRRTKEIRSRAIHHPHASLVDSFAVAYLQGVWDGWQTCEKYLKADPAQDNFSIFKNQI